MDTGPQSVAETVRQTAHGWLLESAPKSAISSGTAASFHFHCPHFGLVHGRLVERLFATGKFKEHWRAVLD